MDVKERVCTGCTVCRGHMDVKERVCTGCTVCRGHMVVPCHPWHHDINISLYVDVKARVCSECIVKILIKAYKQK